MLMFCNVGFLLNTIIVVSFIDDRSKLGHRFDPNTPIEETASLQTEACGDLLCANDLLDASTPRGCESRICSLHWNELLLCLAMWFLFLLPFTRTVRSDNGIHLQSMPCKVCVFLKNLWIPLIFLTDYAIANKLTPFISMQNHYSLLYREEEREMLPTLKVAPYPECFPHCLTLKYE